MNFESCHNNPSVLAITIVFMSVLLFTAIISGCSKPEAETLFQKTDPYESGITFENTIVTNDFLHFLNHVFIYNGAGVAVGDINNNGLPDVFLAGNMVSSRLYLNKGNLKFEDITESAGVGTTTWATGVSMVDINGNGYLDIYVSISASRDVESDKRRNLLFLNNGDNTFTESATEFGIDDDGFTTHAAFLDYNRNGYLDLFLLNNSPEEFARGTTGSVPVGALQHPNPSGIDRLYRNNGDGTFTDVSLQAGIVQKLGYGLGVAVSDLNGNGWPDIYISNDTTPNDVLYINNGDGTFTDRAPDWLRHSSYAGMGIDIEDYTNNGWPDIIQTDMMPEELKGQKRVSSSTSYTAYMEQRRQGFFPYYNMNTLQKNFGANKDGEVIFSEIARIAGVSTTDWSWAALFADFDNDGFKDLLITNGFPKAGIDSDYLTEMYMASQTNDPEESERRRLEIIRNLQGYYVPNYVFRNNGDLTFSNKSSIWGLDEPGYSYGAAYADLNNNGRLDLIVNNINAPAWLYENTSATDSTTHHLQLSLQGEYPNTGGIGSQIRLWVDGNLQYRYHNPYRGYMSSVDPRLHFGLGEATRVDSLLISWPDGRSQKLTDIAANRLISLHQHQADESIIDSSPSIYSQVFRELPPNQSLAHTDRSINSTDYNIQPLLPYQVSRHSPAVAVGDVTGNGLDDVYIGGDGGYPGRLYLQQDDGHFSESDQFQPWQADSDHADWAALFVDINGNGLLDLYVASGGYHSSPVSLILQDRIYINHGNGRFLKDPDALPVMLTSTGTVAAGDFTGDGQMDLFVGGRLTPRNWPYPVRSYVLVNEGGKFRDVTAEVAPEFIEPGGMITDALWIDFDEDGQLDLVTAGQWMPIQFYKNEGASLTDVTDTMGLPPMRGWWNSLSAADLTGNGRPDLVAGNLGLNHTYTATPDSPFGVVAGDFSGNQTTDLILTKEINGTEYPIYGLAKLGREIYTLAIRFDSFETFANSTVEQVVGRQAYQDALRYQADTFASIWLENNPDGTFTTHQLPNIAQISPIKDIIITDADGSGNLDLIVAGNLYQSESTAPRADAGNGLWLKGDGNGNFTPIGPAQSGFLAPKDVKSLKLIQTSAGKLLLVGNNNEPIQVFETGRKPSG